jgi:hypothetical protein
LGHFVWLALWFLLGGASGVPEFGVIFLALVGWFVWTVGMHLLASDRSWALGAGVCIATLLVLVATRVMAPHGTGLVALDIEGAVIGLLPYFKAYRSESVEAAVPLVVA